MSFSPSRIVDGLQVEHFGYLVARRQAAVGWAQADDGREIAHAPVQLGQQHGGDEVQRGCVDQDHINPQSPLTKPALLGYTAETP